MASPWVQRLVNGERHSKQDVNPDLGDSTAADRQLPVWLQPDPLTDEVWGESFESFLARAEQKDATR